MDSASALAAFVVQKLLTNGLTLENFDLIASLPAGDYEFRVPEDETDCLKIARHNNDLDMIRALAPHVRVRVCRCPRSFTELQQDIAKAREALKMTLSDSEDEDA